MVTKRAIYRQNLIKKGLCCNCCKEPLYSKWYCKKCLEKLRVAGKKCYYKNHEKNKEKRKHRNWQKRFGGNRTKVIERDNHSCQICGYNKKVRVHHINENPNDNRLENLITLCIICHTVVERINENKPDLKKIFYWFSY